MPTRTFATKPAQTRASESSHPYVCHQTGANAASEAYPRTSSTKGAETPACEGPGRRLKAAALSPN
jgi:hypothetical protein